VATPLVLVLAQARSAHDGAADVLRLAEYVGARVEAVAMGPPEAEARADALLRTCADKGSWLVVRNGHLASADWLAALENKLRTAAAAARGSAKRAAQASGNPLSAAQAFCVFVAADVELAGASTRLPRRLVARAHVFACGAETGLRAALLRHAALLQARSDSTAVDASDAADGAGCVERGPRERVRCYALLGLAHAVVCERARYAPDAWSKYYDWGDVDATVALARCDVALAKHAQAGAFPDHVAPEHLDWDALRLGAVCATYGSRLERPDDERCLAAVASALLTPDAFDAWAPSAALDAGGAGYPKLPDGPLDMDGWRSWCEAIPRETSCEWLGLPRCAEMRKQQGQRDAMFAAFAKLVGGEASRAAPAGAPLRAEKREVSPEHAAVVAALSREDSPADASAAAAARRREFRVAAASGDVARCRSVLELGYGVAHLAALQSPRQYVAAHRLDAATRLRAAVDGLELALVFGGGDGFSVRGLRCDGAHFSDGRLSTRQGEDAAVPETARLVWVAAASAKAGTARIPLHVESRAAPAIAEVVVDVEASGSTHPSVYLRNIALVAH